MLRFLEVLAELDMSRAAFLRMRARGQGPRVVPIPPVYVRMLRQHIAAFGVAPDGRPCRTSRGGLLQEGGYGKARARARTQALGEDEAASLLARRPYNLRHTGVSF